MKPARKPNSTAVLKNLPEERQAEIFARCNLSSKDGGGFAQVREWLKEDGITTSESALSLWYGWWPLRQQKHQDEQTTEELLDWLKAQMPELTEEQLDDLGQRTFSLLAIRNKDLDGFVSVRSARSKAIFEQAKINIRKQAEARLERKAALEREKFELEIAEKILSQALRDAAEKIATSDMSQADKIKAMRQAAFKDVAALEQSGKLNIPKA